jgi:trans-aconitate methyltransferase
VANWKEFWRDKVQPYHRADTSQHYVEYGRELALLTGDAAGQRVLDLGCGAGSMFEAIGFHRAARYRGIDFSESMLASFRSKHPGVDVRFGDASSYIDGEEYDLIFSNTLAQYFDEAMMLSHLGNAKKMLAYGGRIVIGSIPWKKSRATFYMGGYATQSVTSWTRRAARLALSHVRPDPVGRWFALHEITGPANKLGLATEVYGSMLYPYRIHAKMRIA